MATIEVKSNQQSLTPLHFPNTCQPNGIWNLGFEFCDLGSIRCTDIYTGMLSVKCLYRRDTMINVGCCTHFAQFFDDSSTLDETMKKKKGKEEEKEKEGETKEKEKIKEEEKN